MATELLTSTDFYFLNQNFEAVHKLTQFESLMWVDKYDEPGSFEIYAPPLPEIKEAAQVNNYFKTSRSDKMMIVEELETTVSPENGKRLVIRGRSLESILDRRVIFLKCYFRDEIDDPDPDEGQYGSNNLEDAIRQLLDYCFIHPIDAEREMNLVFQYSDSPEALMDSNHRNITDEFGNPILCDSTETEPINSIHLKDCEFEKGENCLNIVMAIVKQAGLGFQITVNENKQFVFKLTKGKNRTTEQLENPAVVFSPTFNNIKNTKFTEKYGETYKNFVYTEGETYKSRKPTIVKTGDAEGLLRREVYVESSVVHETEASNVTHEGITKNKKTLSEDEYQEALTKDANKYFEKYSGKTTCESEVEPRLTFQYGRDFGIGDVLEIQDGTGNTGKVRCVEFIISYSSSGYEEYPTFKNYGDDDDDPAQSTTSGGQYTDGENKGGGGGGSEYDIKFNQTLDELILTEDSSDKTSVPVIATYNGTRADWNNLSAAEQAKYRHIIFKGESGNADISDELINFTNSDVITSSATAWTNVSVLSSPLSLKTLFSRISQMFKNIRYLYNAVTPVVLWTGSQGSYTTSVSNVNYPLSKSYKNFKLLRFYINCSPDANGSPVRPYVREVSTEQLDFIRGKASHTLSMTWGYGNKTDYTDIQQSSTDMNLVVSQNLTVVTKIEGVNV